MLPGAACDEQRQSQKGQFLGMWLGFSGGALLGQPWRRGHRGGASSGAGCGREWVQAGRRSMEAVDVAPTSVAARDWLHDMPLCAWSAPISGPITHADRDLIAESRPLREAWTR